MAIAAIRTVDTPDGPFTIIAGSHVIASGWTEDVDKLLSLVDPTLRPTRLTDDSFGYAMREALIAVDGYYHGDFGPMLVVPVAQWDAPFRQRCRALLHGIAPRHTITYKELATRAGNPTASRAAASACATNPVALFLPCHRVLREDGDLGGFLYGLDIKRSLLDREAAVPSYRH